MSQRPQKKKRRPGGGGDSRKTQPGKLQADHTLATLLRNFMALPPGSTVSPPGGRMAVSEEAHLYLSAIAERVGAGPAGQARVQDALNSMLPGGNA